MCGAALSSLWRPWQRPQLNPCSSHSHFQLNVIVRSEQADTYSTLTRFYNWLYKIIMDKSEEEVKEENN